MSDGVFLGDVAATESLATRLADTMPPRAVIHLIGDLGAGKSTFARAFLRRLGVTGPIKSPTYTLIERYPLPGGDAAHLDLYRIAEAGELDFLGLDELAAEARLWLVEWPERGGAGLPSADLVLRLALSGTGRSADLEAETAEGRDWLVRLSKTAASRASV